MKNHQILLISLWLTWLITFTSSHGFSQTVQSACCKPSDYICQNNWIACNSTHLFSTMIACHSPQLSSVICKAKLGMVPYNVKVKSAYYRFFAKKRTKIIIRFSFENFASFLLYLQYKKVNTRALKTIFDHFQQKYAQKENRVEVLRRDYKRFRKKYLACYKKLSQSEKIILNEYISFFENKLSLDQPE